MILRVRTNMQLKKKNEVCSVKVMSILSYTKITGFIDIETKIFISVKSVK